MATIRAGNITVEFRAGTRGFQRALQESVDRLEQLKRGARENRTTLASFAKAEGVAADELKRLRNETRLYNAASRDQRRNLRDLRRATAGVAAAFAGISIAAAAAAARGVVQFAEMGDEINNLAAGAGLAVEEYQRLTRVFEFGGASTEQFTQGMVRLSRAIQLAADGSDPAQRSLRQLGITSMDTGEALRQAISNITPDNFQQLLPAIQMVFGDDAIRVFASTLQLTSTEVDHLAARMNVLSEDAVSGLSDLNLELTQFRRDVSVAFGQAVADNAEALRQAVEQIAGVIPGLAASFADLAVTVGERLPPALAEVVAFLSIDSWEDFRDYTTGQWRMDVLGVFGDVSAAAASAADDLDRALLQTGRASQFSLAEIQRLAAAGLSPANASVEELRAALRGLSGQAGAGVAAIPTPQIDIDLPDFSDLSIDLSEFNTDMRIAAEVSAAVREEAERISEPISMSAAAASEFTAETLLAVRAFGDLGDTLVNSFLEAEGLLQSISNLLQNLAFDLLRATARRFTLGLAESLGFGGQTLQFRQRGGPIAPGFAVVGEAGPEILDARTYGRVYSNEQLAAALSGGVGSRGAINFGGVRIDSTDGPGVMRAFQTMIPQLEAALDARFIARAQTDGPVRTAIRSAAR